MLQATIVIVNYIIKEGLAKKGIYSVMYVAVELIKSVAVITERFD